MTQTIAITGASAGIGRAAARMFGQRGDCVGLIARGEAGLDAAARDVQRAGGTALAVPADAADFAQLDAAAGRIEDALGPIDVWVNVAFTSEFAPFSEITPEEFSRVTQVSYLAGGATCGCRRTGTRGTTTAHTASSTTSRIRAALSRCCRTTGWPPPRQRPPQRPEWRWPAGRATGDCASARTPSEIFRTGV